MRVLIRNTALDGRPLEGDGEVFSGATVTDVVLAMKGATLFSDQRDLEDYIDMVLRNAKMLSGVEFTVRGDTPEEKAASFLDALIKHGLAEVQDDKLARIPIPALVWQGIDAVRLSGLTNMLDRPVVARLAGELGWLDAARWKMRRFAEVDSEILFRLAANAARDGAMDIERFKARLRRCRGQITAIIACRTDPGTVFVLKGNRPLELRWHPRRKAVLYASDPAYLDAVLAEEKGWRELPVPPMSLVVFRREDLAAYSVEPFEFVAQERKGTG